MQKGEVDAIVNVDPTISMLEQQKLIKVVADTRTPQGTQAVYGGPYPAAVLYARADYIANAKRSIIRSWKRRSRESHSRLSFVLGGYSRAFLSERRG